MKAVAVRCILAAALLCLACGHAFAAVMSPEASQAFDRYATLVEQDLKRPGPFLKLDLDPAVKRRVLAGEVVVVPRQELDHGQQVDAPHALIHDWQGYIFVPGATLDQLSSALLDYSRYTQYYKPDVIAARLVSDDGNSRRVFLRLYRRLVFPVVLNTEYEVHYTRLSSSQQVMMSKSIHIGEVRHPNGNLNDEEPPGHGFGYLWRLNSYWKFEQTDGGVIAECRAISLTRDIPYGFSWALRDVVEHFPQDSMTRTLEGTRRAGLEGPAATTSENRRSR